LRDLKPGGVGRPGGMVLVGGDILLETGGEGGGMRWGAVSGRLGGRLKLDCKKRLKNKKYKKNKF